MVHSNVHSNSDDRSVEKAFETALGRPTYGPPRQIGSRLFLGLAMVLSCFRLSTAESPPAFPDYTPVESFRATAQLNSVDCDGQRTCLAVGDLGTILRSEDGGLTWNDVPSPTVATLHAVRWLDSRRVVAVGGHYDAITRLSRGVVLSSVDGGRTFNLQTEHSLPCLTTIEIVARGGSGRSGATTPLIAGGEWSFALNSNRFASIDAGRSWNAADDRLPHHSTAANRAIASQNILNLQRGSRSCECGETTISVSSLGKIQLRSRLGNERVVRNQDKELSLAVIAASIDRVPWSTIALRCLQHSENVWIIVADGSTDDVTQRIDQQAALSVGAAGLQHVSTNIFQPDQPKDIAGPSPPSASSDRNPSSLRSILERSLSDAVILLDEQLDVPKRMDRSGVVSFDWTPDDSERETLVPTMGRLRSDFVEDSFRLVAPLTDTNSRFVCDSPLLNRERKLPPGRQRTGDSATNSGQMTATNQNPGSHFESGISRYRLQVASARLPQRKRAADYLFAAAKKPNDLASVAPTLSDLIQRQTDEDRPRLAWVLCRIARQVNSDVESIVLGVMIQDMINDPIADYARWRIEVLRGSRERQWLPAMRTNILAGETKVQTAGYAVSPFQKAFLDVRPASAGLPVHVIQPEFERPGSGDPTQGASSQELDLRWEMHPAVVLQKAASASPTDSNLAIDPSASGHDIAKQTSPHLNLLERSAGGGWAEWLDAANRLAVPHCPVRPVLDGQLDDWEHAAPLRPATQSTPGVHQTQLRVMCDDHYLYVAAEMKIGAKQRLHLEQASPAVGRDQLSGDTACWQLLIDVDGDLVAPLRYRIGLDGSTADDIDGDIRWQPGWYFGRGLDGETMTIEAAFKRADLPPPTAGTWSIASSVIDSGRANSIGELPDARQWQAIDLAGPPAAAVIQQGSDSLRRD